MSTDGPRGPNDDIDADLGKTLSNYRPPSFPEVILRALEQLGDDDGRLQDVSDTLAGDPRMTIKVLSIANSRLATGMPSDSLLALAKLATDEAIEVANLYS